MLQLDDLRRLRSPQAIATLYHLLGYAADQEATPNAAEEIGMQGAAAGKVRRVFLLVDQGDLQHVHFEVGDLSAPNLRGVAETFTRRAGQYLLSFADGGYDQVVFVKPYGEGGAKKLSRLVMRPGRPTAHDLSVLREIAAAPGTPPLEAHAKQVRAFNVERVTRKFYDAYHALFVHVRGTIAAENPGARIGMLARNLTGDQPSLHAFTQRLLGRVIFLYFIQKKGWLDGREDFISDLYRRATAQDGHNFYRDALEPLFFGTLNTPRPDSASPFGRVPYLNGSLFEREYPDTTVLNLPNSLFDPNETGSILHLLNNYNFTVEESGSLDQDVSLDPEMLGKVFENMMEAEEARKSGTFYTPRSVVQFMAEETLTRYLSDHTGLPQDRLLPLCANDGEAHDLSLPEANAIIAALGRVRILDPAVGTASMLVGALNAMVRIRRSAEGKRGVSVTPGGSALADWKREYIQHCLYGVDIKHEAIEIARLRLWLSLVVDAQEPEPLPNLDYKLMAGDGLLETVDGTPFIKAEQGLLGGAGEVTLKTRQIERLHEQFFREEDPQRRRELRGEIQQHERELFKADVDDRIRNLDANLTALNRQIADARQGERARATLLKRHAALSENLGRLIEQKVKVWDEQEPLPFFLHNVHFAEVMKGQGGFDIVIGNPPYVSIGNMDGPYKDALKSAFPDVAAGRADLYVYFFQKGLNLLRDGGRLASLILFLGCTYVLYFDGLSSRSILRRFH